MGPTCMPIFFASNIMLLFHPCLDNFGRLITCLVGYRKWDSIFPILCVSLPCKHNSTNFKIINLKNNFLILEKW